MIIIEDILVSEDILQKRFVCDLSTCKGDCCIEGDYGAPLLNDEVLLINDLLEKILPYIPEASQAKIRDKGFYTNNEDNSNYETELMEDGACVFMGRDELGITFCGIERAHYEGEIEFKKPISCHLYPIRVSRNKTTGFHALNYDKWDICSPACDKGEKEKTEIYVFLKEALIRAYGEETYAAIADAAKTLKE